MSNASNMLTAGLVGLSVAGLLFDPLGWRAEAVAAVQGALSRKDKKDKEDAAKADEVVDERPSVTFDDIGGLEELKTRIKQRILDPWAHHELWARSGSRLVSARPSLLLYGPPGTGKTMIAQAIANACNAHIMYVGPGQLLNSHVGQSQANARAVFAEAKRHPRTVIFLDECESVFGRRYGPNAGEGAAARNDVLAVFLENWGGRTDTGSVLIVGATNRVGSIDEAILSRFTIQAEVAPPGPAQREAILRKLLAQEPVHPLLDYAAVAQATEGLVGRDLHELCRAAMDRLLTHALEETIQDEKWRKAQKPCAIGRVAAPAPSDPCPGLLTTRHLLEAFEEWSGHGAGGAPAGSP